jgi:hypothetical protein
MPNPYKNLFTGWHGSKRGESSRQSSDQAPAPESMDPSPKNSLEEATSSSPPVIPETTAPPPVMPREEFNGLRRAVWEQPVASSSASMSSGKPSTISTYQSSLFSRNAPSFGTVSSFGSAAGSGSGWKGAAAIGENAILEEPELATSIQSGSSESGRLMKVVAPQEMSALVDDPTLLPRPQIPPAHRVPTFSRNMLPDIPMSPPATTEHPAWPERSSFSSTSSSSAPRPQRRILSLKEELTNLAEDLFSVLEQTVSRTLDITRAANAVNQLLRQTLSSPALESSKDEENVTLQSEPSLGAIMKVVLHFVDNLLKSSAAQPVRMYILRALYNLGVKLRLIRTTLGAVPHPRNFAIGSIPVLSGQEELESMLNTVAGSDYAGIAEQEGAFIAPVLRGLAPEFSVLTLVLGFPRPESEHYEHTAGLYDISRDIHIYCQKNSIRACASSKFVAPYRVPNDPKTPPMSVSLANQDATNLSGTLGGYIYPKIDSSDPNLAEYARSTFAITCAHVCLSENVGSNYPHVTIPSPVLINFYKTALVAERNKYPLHSQEHQEYQKAVTQLEVAYPSSVSSPRNKPKDPFGQVVWGERTVVNGSISDIAIIKCRPGMTCRNFLGDDVSFSEYDPALMFGNLHVKRIVRKMSPGMNVFKYGSTSKYTTGKINGPRLVYWADGKLQSSEFVVCSESPVFASGGDSGAWILQKSEDIQEEDSKTIVDDALSVSTSRSTAGPCLGVVGMLHSYDGERKEFGLFTPIDTILERLHRVTNIKWGVVGVPDDEDEDPLAGGSDSSDSGGEESSDGDGRR